MRAVFSKFLSNSFTDTASRTGNHRDFVFENLHLD
jgi:hypothetical protein